MNCPYCNGEMRKGILYFDGRSGAHWNEGDAKQSLSKTIGGSGRVMAAKMDLMFSANDKAEKPAVKVVDNTENFIFLNKEAS